MNYIVVRKHVLTPDAMHQALDALQRSMVKNAEVGWTPLGGLTVFRDFILQVVVNEDDKVRWER